MKDPNVKDTANEQATNEGEAAAQESAQQDKATDATQDSEEVTEG